MLSNSSAPSEDNLYTLSWSNPIWSHLLTTANILDYFCDLSNPFYDRQCNNEIIRMQRLSAEQLLCMNGVEYYLHQTQEPILFVIRKQYRHSSTQVTPLAYYYIINGTILQAPDLPTLLNSRLLTTVNRLSKVLQTLAPSVRYHPSDGSYSWDDPNTLLGVSTSMESSSAADTHLNTPPSKPPKGTATNIFQVKNTDLLLAEWSNRFPPPSTNFLNQSTSQDVPTTSTMSIPTTSTTSASFKEEPRDTNANQRRGIVKPPSLPGVGFNALSVPPAPLPPTSQSERKSRLV